MVRINLLPPEITEKRVFEERIKLVLFAGAVVAFVLVILYLFLAWSVGSKNDVLQQNREVATQVRNQAQAYEVFQDKVDELQARQTVANVALAGRVDWGRITNEVSLVLPSDVWLTRIAGSELEDEPGLEISGYALDSLTDVPDVGHKAVAKTLVRLAELELLTDVWLTGSTKGVYVPEGSTIIGGTDNTIAFTINTEVVKPAADTTQSASVPAPPDQTAP